MKKSGLKLTAAFLFLSMMVVMLVSCSSFGSIKSRFEKEGYTYLSVEDAEEKPVLQAILKTVSSVTVDLGEGNLTCKTHFFLKGVDVAVIFEFQSDADLTKALAESETLKGLASDAQKSDYVNGNCFLLPLSSSSAKTIFKG